MYQSQGKGGGGYGVQQMQGPAEERREPMQSPRTERREGESKGSRAKMAMMLKHLKSKKK